MKYSQRDQLVRDLRELADFVEDRGIELPINIDVSLSGRIATYDRKTFENRAPKDHKRDLKQAIRILKPVKKEYYGSSLNITRKFGNLVLSMHVNREVACRAVPTGNKIIHAATVIPERIEEEIEWICTDPLLKAS